MVDRAGDQSAREVSARHLDDLQSATGSDGIVERQEGHSRNTGRGRGNAGRVLSERQQPARSRFVILAVRLSDDGFAALALPPCCGNCPVSAVNWPNRHGASQFPWPGLLLLVQTAVPKIEVVVSNIP